MVVSLEVDISEVFGLGAVSSEVAVVSSEAISSEVAVVGSEHAGLEIVGSEVVASGWLHSSALQKVDAAASSLSEVVALLLGIVWLCSSPLSVGFVECGRLVHGEWTLAILNMGRMSVTIWIHDLYMVSIL